MAVGIYAKTLYALVGEYETLSAQFHQVLRQKRDERGDSLHCRVGAGASLTAPRP